MAIGHSLENRENVLDRGDLHVGDHDERIFEIGRHFLAVGDHVGTDVSLVVLKALGEDELVFARLALVDGDDPVLADLVHRIGDEVADFLAAGRNGRNRFDVSVGRDGLADLEEFLGDGLASLFHASADEDRVGALLDGVDAAMDHALGKDGRGRRAVTGFFVGLVGDFVDELGAHVLDRVLKLDFAGDRNPVFANRRRAIALVEGHVAAFRPEGQFDGIGKFVDAGDHLVAGGLAKIDVLCHKIAFFLSWELSSSLSR